MKRFLQHSQHFKLVLQNENIINIWLYFVVIYFSLSCIRKIYSYVH